MTRASKSIRRSAWVAPILGLATAAGLALAPGAGASGQFNLVGSWKAVGTGGGEPGVVVIKTFNKATGAFSGTSFNGMFKVKGTETGSAISFTQSEPGYTSTDTGTVTDGGKKMGGQWHDTNGSGGTWTATKVGSNAKKKKSKKSKKAKPKKKKSKKAKPKKKSKSK